MKLSLRKKLNLQFFLIGVFPMLTMGTISFYLEKETIIKTENAALHSLSANKKAQVENFFTDLDRQIRNFADNPQTIDAAKEFVDAFHGLNEEPLEFNSNTLQNFYGNQFAGQYEKLNGKSLNNPNQIFQSLDARSRYLQTQYIANNPNPLGSKHQLAASQDNSNYDSVHAKYHPYIMRLNDRNGYYDTFIIDAKTGHIVYSVFKESDFAASVIQGPLADTSINQAFRAASQGGANDRSYLSNFKSYLPSYDDSAGFVSAPIRVDGEVIAVAVHQVSKIKITELLAGSNMLGSSYESVILSDNDTMITESNQLKEIKDKNPKFQANFNIPAVKEALSGKSGSTQGVSYLGYNSLMAFDTIQVGNQNWALISQISEDEALKPIETLGYWIFGIAVASALFTTISGFLIGKRVANPIQSVSERLDADSTDINKAAGDLSRSGAKLSEITATQASAIEETAASIEEISAMIKNNVEQAEQSTALSLEVQRAAGAGNDSMHSLIKAMEDLVESNKKIQELVKVVAEIGEKTTVIDEIVFQTKLLSFNASVEAERAGEHGRGFSVVAQEVGNLAQMSGKAASEISTMVRNSVEQAQIITKDNETQVSHNNQLVHKTAEYLNLISDSSATLLTQAQQIVESSKEQVEGINQVNEAMNQIDQATQESALTAENTARSSERLSQRADNLLQATSVLKELISARAEEGNQKKSSGSSTSLQNQESAVMNDSNVIKIPDQKPKDVIAPSVSNVQPVIKKVSGEWSESASAEDNWNSL